MRRSCLYCWALIAALQACTCRSLGNIFKRPRNNHGPPPADLEYDLVIVGAGASGLFASGASSMLGSKTLLIDTYVGGTSSNLGGDCTNSACVPSKALRSMGQSLTSATGRGSKTTGSMESARRHATNTVQTVRARESAEGLVDRNPMLDFILVNSCHFESPNHMVLGACESYSSARVLPFGKNVTIHSKQFLIATGASPVVPVHLEEAAQRAGLLTYTYRTLLRPSESETAPESIWHPLHESSERRRIVVVGGGATACELGQTLARLGGNHTILHLVAPALLHNEDITLQNAAVQLLAQDGVKLHLRNRVEDILVNKQVRLSDGTLLPPADAIVFCVGRKPTSLGTLRLENANIDWSEDLGVTTNKNLRSTTAPHVFACGDCCSAVASKPTSRTATQGAWTGYHAATNAKVPAILRVGSQSCHPIVPRVVYTDPELSSVGMSLEECTRKYGSDGFDRLAVSESQTDRADMDSKLRNTIGFVEIRAAKVTGKILGFTGCGPVASELANEMSLAIQNGLTALDVTRSLHSYPSHGYLMHRVALALAFSNMWGQIEALGHIGRVVATAGRLVNRVYTPLRLMKKRRELTLLREWEANGVREGILCPEDFGREEYPETEIANNVGPKVVSFMDVYNRLGAENASGISEDPLFRTASTSEIKLLKDWLSSSSNGASLLKSIESSLRKPGPT
jgi:pyruvate/2-oxoglutarate dehydrogenase complex dihydrolipoamide dehydrogenase (E3) component